MTDNTDLFEYLFAVRISLQDDFENESDIIRELKLTLRDMGMGSSQSNQLLHDFYQSYGIDISLETIKEASTVSNQLLNNMLGFMLSSGDFAHAGHPDDGNDDDDIVNEANNVDNEDEDVNDEDDNDDDIDENEQENNNVNVQNINHIFEQALLQALGINVSTHNHVHNNTHVPEAASDSSENAQPAELVEPAENAANSEPATIPVSNPVNNSGINANITVTINGNTYSINSQNPQLVSSLMNNSNGINMINSPFIQNAPMMNFNQIGTHGSMINVINSLLGGSHGLASSSILPIPLTTGPSMFSDVVVSTDDKDLESLKTIKLETNLDTDCSICMGHLEKDEEVSELKCSHTFHTECIKPYLRQYNYKCPVCRAEVGKAKYNI